MSEQPQSTDLGERIAAIEGEMKHLATKDFVRELIVEQTKELNTAIQDSHRVVNEKIDEQTKSLQDELKGVKNWQNRITGGGAALAILVSLPLPLAI